MNKIILIGNLTNDPETRTTQSGVSVCTFSIAVNRRFSQAGGERQTDFFRINAWRQLGDNCQRFLAKGRKVAVVGELQPRTYEDKNGVTRMSLDITADEVEFLTPKNAQEGGAPAYTSGSGQKNTSPLPDLAGFENISEDELPF
ncbi:MAG TPA: single-stranded DNA-binding protein [Feifaniaceae bacterium]|nr:single-stranded DNA-binding protein [Feifaniaceae bacterium]